MNKKYILFCFGEHFVAGNLTSIFLRDNYGQTVTEEEINDRIKVIEEGLKSSDYFSGCDYHVHVSVIDGKEDYLKGVLFTDVMGQQCMEVLPLNEQDMVDTILRDFEKNAVDNVLQLPIENLDSTFWDEDSALTKYKPMTIVKRVDDEGETQYDVECIATDFLGVETNYVENLDTIGYQILFNIYISLTRC